MYDDLIEKQKEEKENAIELAKEKFIELTKWSFDDVYPPEKVDKIVKK